jgi:hypothetical protein
MSKPNTPVIQAVRHPNFPFILLLVINLAAGLLTFRDYGLSWDEPLFYQYADAIPYAYSIRERLSGSFNIENAYGPSSEDHKIYGPAYLLPAKVVVDLLDWALPASRPELWHLVNFLAFQIGMVFFYALCQRWMSAWAAFGATLLFSTQPIVWGHAWINPKDIPFMVFFIAAIFLGFQMVDRLSPGETVSQAMPAAPAHPSDLWPAERWKKLRRIFQALALAGLVLMVAAYALSVQWQELLSALIHNAYLASPNSLLGRLFSFLAANAGTVSEQAYVNKGLILFSRLKITLAVLACLLLVSAALFTFWLTGLQRGAAWLGEKLAPLPAWPAWWVSRLQLRHLWIPTLLAGTALGLLTSIRIVGPLAGVLVGLYFFLRSERRPLAGMVIYTVVAVLVMVITWPYLWDAPLRHLVEVFQHMARNPQVVSVVFNGSEYPSDRLPVIYLPVMLAITLTLPVWPLFFGGLVFAARRVARKTIEWRSLAALLLWFLLIFAYVLLKRPPMYDGYRHFLFILPPVFICAGLALQFILKRSRRTWLNALLLAALALPGVVSLVTLHPYQYTYYNTLMGGTGGASRRFETDYWLTCYREIIEQVNANTPPGVTLFVHRQPAIAQQYAAPGLLIERFDPDDDQTFSGSLLLLSSRTNVDQKVHLEAPILYSVGRDGAVFCVVKKIP